jgi:UDP-N-acetyl-D-mannosaminuronate dehydrogenase
MIDQPREWDAGKIVKMFRERDFLRADCADPYITEYRHRLAHNQLSNDFRRIVSR